MNPAIKTAYDQMEQAYAIWKNVSPNFSIRENFNDLDINIENIDGIFEEITSILLHIEESNQIDYLAWSQYKTAIVSTSNQIYSHFQSYSTSPLQIEGYIPTMLGWLWTLRNQLISILSPSADFKGFKKSAPARIAYIEGLLQRTIDLKGQIEEKSNEFDSALKTATETKSKVLELSESLDTSKVEIISKEREAGTAKTNAEAAALNAATAYTQVSELTEKLSTASAQQDSLFLAFENKKTEIEQLLSKANQVGLAKSFKDRHIELEKQRLVWNRQFTYGIVGLVGIGSVIFYVSISDSLNLQQILTRVVLISPLIWFTWFSARQYSHTLNLSEDYAFKEAAAMSYIGYRDEIFKSEDKEMILLLQSSAIKTYAENPAKILLKNTEPASPINQALEKAISQLKPDELIEALKNYISNKK